MADYLLAKSDAHMPAIVALAEQAHAEGRFSYIPFSAQKVQALARTATDEGGHHSVMLAVKDGSPVGFAACSVGEYHMGTGVLITTLHGIYVPRPFRASLAGGRVAFNLFRAVERWSKTQGAKEVLLHVTSGVELERSHKLVGRLGFKLAGGSYGRTL